MFYVYQASMKFVHLCNFLTKNRCFFEVTCTKLLWSLFCSTTFWPKTNASLKQLTPSFFGAFFAMQLSEWKTILLWSNLHQATLKLALLRNLLNKNRCFSKATCTTIEMKTIAIMMMMQRNETVPLGSDTMLELCKFMIEKMRRIRRWRLREKS